GAAGVGVAGEEVAAELRGDDDAVASDVVRALGAEEVADDLLGVALGVAVGGVEEVPAALEVRGEDRAGVLRRGAGSPLGPEGHRAQAEGRDAQAGAAEGDVVGERGHYTAPSMGGP